MAWNDATELVVPGNGQVYIADIGTTLPAISSDPTAALNAAFEGLGYWTEDGATLVMTPTIAEFRAFQERQAVRRELTSQEVTVAVQFEQWNELTVPTALGGTINSGGSFPTFVPPAPGDSLPEQSVVVDLQDGDRNMRIVFPRANAATEAVTAQFQRAQLAVLPVTFKALAPTDGSDQYYILFDDTAAFAAGS